MTKLYKYRAFGVNTLTMLCDSHVYYSDPSQFNDPLDCDPSIIDDVPLQRIEHLYYQMYINDKGKEKEDAVIQNIRNISTEYGNYTKGKGVESYYKKIIVDHIKQLLDKIMKNKGVLSLAEQWDSPLMWSHYADEHKGICIEYDISSSIRGAPQKVDYEGARGISTSTLIDWVLNDSESAKREIENKYFYTKANQWKYEYEWRYVNDSQGSVFAPFNITGIYFGMRCNLAVISSIVKLMNGSKSNLKFYNTRVKQNSFDLRKSEVEVGELEACTPRSSAALMFADVGTNK